MLEDKIQEVREHLTETDDLSVLSDWETYFVSEFAYMAVELAKVKRDRATKELALKAQILSQEGKYTEKEIERQYFASGEGKVYLYNTTMLSALSKLISAIRFKRSILVK